MVEPQMWNFPTAPTDNLYKFLALTGLALLLFSLVYPANLMRELELRAAETKTRHALLKEEITQLQDDIQVAMARDSKSADEWLSLKQRHQELRLKKIQADGETRLLAVLIMQTRYVFNALVLGSLLGYGMAHLGFHLWYTRVQRPADQATLRREKSES